MDLDDPQSYREALKASHKEAKATLWGALALFVFFWLAIYLLHLEPTRLLGLPVWFWVAVIGGYFVSIVVVWVLARFVFNDRAFDRAISSLNKINASKKDGE